MKQPIIIDRENPLLTRFYCLTCGERVLFCGTCRRYLCACTNKEWHDEYDYMGIQCDKCYHNKWPTEAGYPWDSELGTLIQTQEEKICICGKPMYKFKRFREGIPLYYFWKCDCGEKIKEELE